MARNLSLLEPSIFNAKQGAEIVIAKVRLDNSQRYRKQVQTKAKSIRPSILSKLALQNTYWSLADIIRPAAFRNLTLQKERLCLTEEAAENIHEEFLKPYRAHLGSLRS